MSAQSYTSNYAKEAIGLLSDLIRTPSLSGEERETAIIIKKFLHKNGVKLNQKKNNVWAANLYYDSNKPSILLNSHHDTVKPNAGYTNDPYDPIRKDGKLFGLGSNDAGASLVSLIQVFLHYYERKDIPYNLFIAATAEEENSGKNGIALVLPELPPVEFGMIGEPTKMQMATAEKGLIVLDCYANGKAGHAAREEGVNAIYEAMKDIEWFSQYSFEKVSDQLGAVKMNVTVIDAGKQHNVVPDHCHFVVDVRTVDGYTNQEVVEIIKDRVSCEVKPRSLRLNPSSLPVEMLISKVGDDMGIEKYGSPTLSDQALMDFPTFKMGPGDSARSHSADEYVCLREIEEGIQGYINLLDELFSRNGATSE